MFYCLFIYSYVHILFGPSLPPVPPTPSYSPQLFSHPGKTSSAFFSNFVEEKTLSDNKKDIAFLQVELRIAIQRDS
jgi:hypothetical protein